MAVDFIKSTYSADFQVKIQKFKTKKGKEVNQGFCRVIWLQKHEF